MKKILFVVLILAAVFTAGCITSPQIPQGCGGLQTDEECAASLSTTPAPTESNVVVKSEQVAATPMPTETMPLGPGEFRVIVEIKNLVHVKDTMSLKEMYDKIPKPAYEDNVLGIKVAILESTDGVLNGKVHILAKANKNIAINLQATAIDLTPEEKLQWPIGRIDGYETGIPANDFFAITMTEYNEIGSGTTAIRKVLIEGNYTVR